MSQNLKILRKHSLASDGHANIICECFCGKLFIARSNNVQQGKTQSCGCVRKTLTAITGRLNKTHGESRITPNGTPEYKTWWSMKRRCYYPEVNGYKYYGERGIKVCKRWLHSYQNFLQDMGRKPSSQHSLDRINPNGNYNPKNCRWATPSEQQKNKR